MPKKGAKKTFIPYLHIYILHHLACQAISFIFAESQFPLAGSVNICVYIIIICTYVYVHKYRTHSTGDFYHLFLYTCINSSGAWHFRVQKNPQCLQRIVWRVNRDPKIEVTKSIWKNASEIPIPNHRLDGLKTLVLVF